MAWIQGFGVNSSHYYLWLSDNQAGPYSLQQVAAMWSLGAITAETLWWNEESAQWEAISTLEPLIAKEAEEDDSDAAQQALRAAKFLTYTSAVVLLLVTVGGGLFLWNERKQSRIVVSQAQPAMTTPARPTNSAADLILKAELSLAQSDFESATDWLNTVPSEYPQSEEAEIVAKFKKVLRKSDEVATPLNSEEGERIGKLFEAFEALQDAYHLFGSTQKQNLEVIFGPETFRRADKGLANLAEVTEKLQKSRGL